jgi:hypothetical protein
MQVNIHTPATYIALPEKMLMFDLSFTHPPLLLAEYQLVAFKLRKKNLKICRQGSYGIHF